MPLPTILDLENMKQDIADLELVVNAVENTDVQTRLGKVHKSLTGRMQDLQDLLDDKDAQALVALNSARSNMARYSPINYRGQWSTAEPYAANDVWRDVDDNLWIAVSDYTSAAFAEMDIESNAVKPLQSRFNVIAAGSIDNLAATPVEYTNQMAIVSGNDLAGSGPDGIYHGIMINQFWKYGSVTSDGTESASTFIGGVTSGSGVVNGSVYRINLSITLTSGSVDFVIGGQLHSFYSSGDYNFTKTAESGGSLYLRTRVANTICSVASISVVDESNGVDYSGDNLFTVTATDGSQWKRLNKHITLEMFGAVHNDPVATAANNAALLSAKALAEAYNIAIDMAGRTYYFAGQSFVFNVSKTQLISSNGKSGMIFQSVGTGIPYAVKLIGSDSYTSTNKLTREFINNVDILSTAAKGSELDCAGLELGSNSATERISSGSLSNFCIQGFKKTIRYKDNCWKISHNNLRLMWGIIETPTVANDFGECMTFNDSFIADTNGVFSEFNKGEWKFFGTSFDNAPFRSNNDTLMDFFGGHVENPKNTSLTITFAEANDVSCINFHGSWVTTNNRPLQKPPFTSNVSLAKTGGIHFDKCTWNMNGDYEPKNYGYLHNFIVGGSGRSSCKGMHFLGYQDYFAQPISPSTNMIANGNFETGTVSGWSIKEIGTEGSLVATVDTVNPHSGTYAAKLTATYPGGGSVHGGELFQRLPVSGNDIVAGGIYYRNDWNPESTAGLFQVLLYFRTAMGELVEEYVEQRIQTLVESYGYINVGKIAPIGACYCDVAIQVSSNLEAPLVSAWIDDVHIDVLSQK